MTHQWEHFFKPEVRAQGRRIFNAKKVSSRQVSDTEVQAFVKDTSGFKVLCKSLKVASLKLNVNCSCPQFQRGQFCKHIWATLLKIEDAHSDLLECKTELHRADEPQSSAPKAKEKKENTVTQTEIQAAYKLKQKAYRKQAYEKQKQRLKDIKASKKTVFPAEKYSEPVQKALDYFAENGFPMDTSLTQENLALAKKKLSKVFHPDLGGSHDEILELNQNLNELLRFLQSKMSSGK